MAFDSKKTILLEKTYLYVRASLGFQLEGTSTEKIPTNNGFYRFFVDNLQKAIGNSYVNILYDSQDLTLQCFCSDLYMDELMSSDSSAIEDVVEELKKNTTTILEFENGVSSALSSNHEDNVALSAVVQGVGNTNHTDISGISETFSKYFDTFLGALGIYNNFSLYYRNGENSVLSVPLNFCDFKKNLYKLYDRPISAWCECLKKFSIADSNSLEFFCYLNVPSYFSEISNIFDSFTFQVYGESYSNVQNSLVSTVVTSFGGKNFIEFKTFSKFFRTTYGVSGNYYNYTNLFFRISENLYKFLCLCSYEKNNFFSDGVSISSNSDSFYITRGQDMPCCSLNQKLNINKKFDSVQDYEFGVDFDFPFDEDTFKKFHFYFLVNNSFIEVVPTFVNKGLHDLLNCNFRFTGSSSYYIESMSVFPF